jgi:hypothetical protein
MMELIDSLGGPEHENSVGHDEQNKQAKKWQTKAKTVSG